MSMPPCESAREAAVRFPSKVSVSVTPIADWRGVELFCGETLWVNGRSTFKAVYKEEGIVSGRVDRNGIRTEGADSCRELERRQQ